MSCRYIKAATRFNLIHCKLDDWISCTIMSRYNNGAVVEQPKQMEATDHRNDTNAVEDEKDAEVVGSKHVDGDHCQECCCVTLNVCSDVTSFLRACL